MNKLENLKKSLQQSYREAKDIDAFRTTIKKALANRQYSWFELFYEQDKGCRIFVDAVEEYLWKPLAEERMIGGDVPENRVKMYDENYLNSGTQN